MGFIQTRHGEAWPDARVHARSSASTLSLGEGPRSAIEHKLETLDIPVPRAVVRERMGQLGALIGGPQEILRGHPSGGPAGIRLPAARLNILGTACRRPLLCAEAEELQKVNGDRVVILRLDDDPAEMGEVTCDVLLPDGSWLKRYRLWQELDGMRLWFVPSEGEGQSALLSPWGLDLINRAPFYSLSEREAGFEQAARSLRTYQVGR